MKILVIDIGGTNVKLWTTGSSDKFKDRHFDRVSIGYPGEVQHGRPVKDPYNLAPGWVEFDFDRAFECPVRVMNDASMQAMGSYDGGRMLYLGLGTSVGTVFVSDGKIVPLALGHLMLNSAVMLGGGNAKKIPALPEYCRRGGNFNAYIGGLRMWDDALHLDDFRTNAPDEVQLRVTEASL
jgi:predicted NBD/HSP70 family sugar kinase